MARRRKASFEPRHRDSFPCQRVPELIIIGRSPPIPPASEGMSLQGCHTVGLAVQIHGTGAGLHSTSGKCGAHAKMCPVQGPGEEIRELQTWGKCGLARGKYSVHIFSCSNEGLPAAHTTFPSRRGHGPFREQKERRTREPKGRQHVLAADRAEPGVSFSSISVWLRAARQELTSDPRCLVCRQRKVACDRRRPRCALCSKNGFDCEYQSRQHRPGLRAGYVSRLESQLRMLDIPQPIHVLSASGLWRRIFACVILTASIHRQCRGPLEKGRSAA